MRQPTHSSLNLTMAGESPRSASEMPNVASVIPWRTWSEGQEEAQRRQVPMLVLAEPAWTNSAQRIAYVIEQNASLRSLLCEEVVPVLVNPDVHPDLVTTWRYVSTMLTGTSGPPLLVFLTHEGLPFLSYCTMQPEGDDTYPSLISLIQSVTEEYARNSDRFLAEAVELAHPDAPGTDGASVTDWDALRLHLDLHHGGLNEIPKHPRPALLWSILDAHKHGDLPDDLVRWLEKSLDSMIRGAMYDQLDRGFHRCARDDRWVLPHFEKPVPLNAHLVAVYARASAQLRNHQFRNIANHLLSFCSVALRENVDAIASDSEYYTWTSKEVLKTLEPALVQVVSLHYNIVPIPNRQALYRVAELEEMDRYSHEDIDVLRARLAKGKAQLRLARQRRPAPPLISVAALSWRAETIRWVLTASLWLKAVDVPEIIASLERLIDGRLDAEQGYLRETGAAYLEDQAALLAAFVAAHQATENPHWLERARSLADILLTSYLSDTGWKDRLGAETPSRAILDDVLPSTLGTLMDALQQLSALVDDPTYGSRATEAFALLRPMIRRSSHWIASIPRRTG